MKRQRPVNIEAKHWDAKEFWRGPSSEAEAKLKELFEARPGAPYVVWNCFGGEEVPWVRVVYFVPRIVKEELPAVVAMYSEPDTAGMVH